MLNNKQTNKQQPFFDCLLKTRGISAWIHAQVGGPAGLATIGADWGQACQEEEMVRGWRPALPGSGLIRAGSSGGEAAGD